MAFSGRYSERHGICCCLYCCTVNECYMGSCVYNVSNYWIHTFPEDFGYLGDIPYSVPGMMNSDHCYCWDTAQ